MVFSSFRLPFCFYVEREVKHVQRGAPPAPHTLTALNVRQAMPMMIKPNCAHPVLNTAKHANTPQAIQHYIAMTAKMAITEIVLATAWSVLRIVKAAKGSQTTVRTVPVGTSWLTLMIQPPIDKVIFAKGMIHVLLKIVLCVQIILTMNAKNACRDTPIS